MIFKLSEETQKKTGDYFFSISVASFASGFLTHFLSGGIFGAAVFGLCLSLVFFLLGVYLLESQKRGKRG